MITASIRHTILSISVLACALAFSGCSSVTLLIEPTQTVAGMPAPNAYEGDPVRTAILAGLARKRWNVVQERHGVIVARVDSRGHYAVVAVAYASAGWTISHVESSPGLQFRVDDRGRQLVHGTYNNWVQILDRTILQAYREGWPAPDGGAYVVPATAEPAGEPHSPFIVDVE